VGAEAGTSTKTCPVCQGSGEVRNVSRSVFGQFVNISTCNNCSGEGRLLTSPAKNVWETAVFRVMQRLVSIDVPSGVHEGSYMTMRGEGNAGKRNGPAGDIIVVFQELPHEYFIRDGDDIIYDLYITVSRCST
jgi:molecular chaperone DnaJ